MKAIKILFKTILWIVVILVIVLLALPLWFGPVGKTVANVATPKVTLTDFRLGHLYLNPYTARFELRDMQLSNPEGYSEKFAATLGDLTFDAEMLSLMTDVIHIEEITVKDVFVSVVNGGPNNVGNFKQIQYNVAGGKERYEAAEVAKQEAKAAELEKIQLEEMQNPKAAEEEKAKIAAEEKPAKKIIIDKLHISGLKIQLGIIPISVPVTIELADIGRKSGGATFEEAWQQIWAGILKATGAVGDQMKALGGLVGDGAARATESVGKAAAQATESAGKAVSAVGDAAGAATKSVGKATDAVTGAASKATESATKAVEGATKALDSLKELW